MATNLHLHEMITVVIFRYMKDFPFKADAVVGAYRTFKVLAKDVVKIETEERNKGASFDCRWM